MLKNNKDLLIITQKIDHDDPVLGFFHRWVAEFSKHYRRVTVICLEEGSHQLPDNVKVLSLGKEKKQSRLKSLFNFYTYLWRERKNYGRVFVHMNQEYILLAGGWWRLIGKPIDFWYNHRFGNWRTRVAVSLANRVYCTSPQSFTAQFAKTRLMPVGIDTNLFAPDPLIAKDRTRILYVGRSAPIKRVDLLLRAVEILKRQGVDFKLEVVSNVTYDHLPPIYNRAWLVINLTPTGSFDKVIFEAMACQTLVLAANRDLADILPAELLFAGNDPALLAQQISLVLQWEESKAQSLTQSFRQKVVARHSLVALANKLK